jgi:hypothetical protein
MERYPSWPYSPPLLATGVFTDIYALGFSPCAYQLPISTFVPAYRRQSACTDRATEMVQIEKSNLSRRFLFRNTDINRPKSTTAVRAVTAMSLAFHAVAYESKVRARV